MAEQALILAAGKGTRMRPLTARLPKPLLPAGGAPFLEHQLRALAEAGVTHVAGLVGYRMREVHEALGDFDLFIGSNIALTNLTGHPEISMPNGFFRGSPTSLRFTGKLFGEAEILLLAHAYQAATDHHLQHPTL